MTQRARVFRDFLKLRLPYQEGGAVVIGRSRRGAFTMVELIMIVAILGILAMIVMPRISSPWTEPPKRVLQRAIIEAVDMAKSGASVRFRMDTEENMGAIIPEVLLQEEGNAEGSWQLLKLQWELTGKWTLDPEIIYLDQDGTCTPARIESGTPPDSEKFLLTVTGFLVDNEF